MANNSITVRLSPHDIGLIDKKIKEGYFTSRSDVIRYSIRHLLHELESREHNLDILADIAGSKDITMEDIRKAIRKERKETYEDVYSE